MTNAGTPHPWRTRRTGPRHGSEGPLHSSKCLGGSEFPDHYVPNRFPKGGDLTERKLRLDREEIENQRSGPRRGACALCHVRLAL
jgi:hypothetical protein